MLQQSEQCSSTPSAACKGACILHSFTGVGIHSTLVCSSQTRFGGSAGLTADCDTDVYCLGHNFRGCGRVLLNRVLGMAGLAARCATPVADPELRCHQQLAEAVYCGVCGLDNVRRAARPYSTCVPYVYAFV